jgi:hypothetical protein
MKFHLDKVEDMAGFAVENAKPGDILPILVRARLTSDDPEFYQYSEQISNMFLNNIGIPADNVHQFLVVIHSDLSADVYVNDITLVIEIKPKRDIKAGEVLTQSDIADVRRVKFQEIETKATDRIIYCFKVGWRFGLFFDLSARPQPTGSAQALAEDEKLDVEKMELSIGDLRRYLSFYHVYKVLESQSQFEEMMKDGWFPFVEILAREHRQLSEAYQNKFDFENRIKTVVDDFSEERIERITEKWWKNQIFAGKRLLIEAGINAYLQNTQDGFINCIKNLWTEIEGILRKVYHVETGKGDRVKSGDLIHHIVEKAKRKSGSDHSLLFPLPFLNYLEDVVFADFNVEMGRVDLSRHSSSHGVADVRQYTKTRALQLILILDQIYFYS